MDLRVLILAADGAPCTAAAERLRGAGYETRVAGTVAAALGVAGELQPDVAVLHVAALGPAAAAAVARVREASGPQVRIVAAAAPGSSDRVAELAAAGVLSFVGESDVEGIVDAVVVAGDDGAVLAPEFASEVMDEVARLYRDLKGRNDDLEEMVGRLQALSVTDWLTGLKNHGYFFERLGDEVDRALRHGRSLAMLMADLDDFKGVNDTHGHAAGDRVLRAVGEVMLDVLRSADVVCRIGGEEFAVLLPETDAAGGMLVAERIRDSFEEHHVPGVGTVTLSFGVAALPEHAMDQADLMESADRALYLAKREGKNRCRLAGQVPALRAAPVARPLRGEVVELLMRVLRLREPALADHALRTAEVAVALGARLSLSATEMERLRVAALLQDIGKIGIPDALLTKPGPLTSAEWAIMHEHPRRGFEIVSSFVHPDAAHAVLANHERYDGSGYPRGLTRGEIPLLGRILLAADAYAAMTEPRPYREPLRTSEALAELRRNAGSQFDPTVVGALTDLAHRNRDLAAGE